MYGINKMYRIDFPKASQRPTLKDFLNNLHTKIY
jgi:hypothetical protein